MEMAALSASSDQQAVGTQMSSAIRHRRRRHYAWQPDPLHQLRVDHRANQGSHQDHEHSLQVHAAHSHSMAEIHAASSNSAPS
jgi:RecA-family ATPase